MPSNVSLRRELVTAFTLVFACALLVAVFGVLLVVPRIGDPLVAGGYVLLIILLDLAIFTLFGRWLIRKRVLLPLDELVAGVEAIAAGESERALPQPEARELSRLGEAVNAMTERLIDHQRELADNIRSLDETNRSLTEARDELVQAEKMASAGRLSAGIAHEIGNPLGSLMGYLAVLAKRAPEPQRELLAAAEGEARRIDRIVHGLLDYGRPREANARPIDANDVVHETLELLRAQGRLDGLEVREELAEGLPLVKADPYRLQQALLNLALNAVDAMEGRESRRLALSTGSRAIPRPDRRPIRRRDDPPGIDYSHRRRFHDRPHLPRDQEFPAGRAVAIVVQDSGPGIAPELNERLFEPFVTTKEPGKGTGLGLAVTARLIDAMEGTIVVDSRPGAGATFTVLLPPLEEEERT